MPKTYAIVWLDHQNAKVFLIPAETNDLDKHEAYHAFTLHNSTKHPQFRMRHKQGPNAGRRRPNEHGFYSEIASVLAWVDQVLVLGPGLAKTEFVRHASAHCPEFEKSLIGIQTVDHPRAVDLLRFAEHYFDETDSQAALDRLRRMARKHSAPH